jgi:hypothetical protein
MAGMAGRRRAAAAGLVPLVAVMVAGPVVADIRVAVPVAVVMVVAVILLAVATVAAAVIRVAVATAITNRSNVCPARPTVAPDGWRRSLLASR